MRRHRKASILPTSSVRMEFTDSLAYLIREAMELSVRERTKILRFIWIIFFTFIICFLYTIWNIPQTNDNSSETCTRSSYQILGGHNSITGCKECPDCPPGQQLTPPCGSKVQPDALINCTVCPSGTFKDISGRGICKLCLTCGPRVTVSSCTSSKNAQCGTCPRGTFQWSPTVDTCKQCSSCCAPKRFAEVECFYLRQCLRTNCTQEIENEGNDIQKLEINSQRFATIINPPNPAPLLGVSSSKNSGNAKKLALKNILKRTRVTRDVPQVLQGVSEGNTTKLANEKSATLLSNNSDTFITTITKSFEEFGTVSTDLNTADFNLHMASSCFGMNFAKLVKIIIIVIVAISILALFTVCVIVYFCCKRQSRHLQPRYCVFNCCINLKSTEEYNQLLDETTHQIGDDTQVSLINGNLEGSFSEKSTSAAGLENTPLSDISPFLEDILVKKLEVDCGWKKVGKALQIDQDDLDYWKNGKSMESPATGELLRKLRATRPEFTIADLIDILESPDVKRRDVVQRIRLHLQNEVK